MRSDKTPQFLPQKSKMFLPEKQLNFYLLNACPHICSYALAYFTPLASEQFLPMLPPGCKYHYRHFTAAIPVAAALLIRDTTCHQICAAWAKLKLYRSNGVLSVEGKCMAFTTAQSMRQFIRSAQRAVDVLTICRAKLNIRDLMGYQLTFNHDLNS
jgi:hypothetical protein